MDFWKNPAQRTRMCACKHYRKKNPRSRLLPLPAGGSSASRNSCQASCSPPPPSQPSPSTLLAGPAGWLAHAAHGSLPPPPRPAPPPSRPSAGREPACLSRPIYHRHSNHPRESASPCPGAPARTAPDGQSPGSVTATAGRRGKPAGAGPPRPRPLELPPSRRPGRRPRSALGSPIFIRSNPQLGGEHRRRARRTRDRRGRREGRRRERERVKDTGEATEGRKKERAAWAPRRRTQHAARRSSTRLRAPRGPALPTSQRPGPRGSACVGGRGPAGPAKGWRESLMSCAAH